MTTTTDGGTCFLSYPRVDSAEVDHLDRALRRRGVATWIDRADLPTANTEDAITRTIADDRTTCGVAWITRAVEPSHMIRKVELPAMWRRADDGDDPFFLVTAVRDRMPWAEAAELAGRSTNAWNFLRAHGPIGRAAKDVADEVLRRRLETLHETLPADEPIPVALFARRRGPRMPTTALHLDWNPDFKVRGRGATVHTWRTHLIPAAHALSDSVMRNAPGRALLVEGSAASVTAAAVFGEAFRESNGVEVLWKPTRHNHDPEPWHLGRSDGSTPLKASSSGRQPHGTDLAVLVSVTNDVLPAFESVEASLPSLRATISFSNPDDGDLWFKTGAPAAAAARQIRGELRRARTTFKPTGVIHLFMAVPFGLAMMIGQLLDTFGPVHVHEFVADDGVGSYIDGPVLRPTR